MVLDISRKYIEFSFPEKVSLAEIARIKHLYSIPACIVDSIPECSDMQNSYDAKLDIRSCEFDPLTTLQRRHIVAAHMHTSMLDNLSKARQLLPGNDVPVRHIEAPAEPDSSHANPKHTRSKTVPYNVLNRIALTSSKVKVLDDQGATCLRDSPLALIHACMKEKARVRVIIRRINRCGIGQANYRKAIHTLRRLFDLCRMWLQCTRHGGWICACIRQAL